MHSLDRKTVRIQNLMPHGKSHYERVSQEKLLVIVGKHTGGQAARGAHFERTPQFRCDDALIAPGPGFVFALDRKETIVAFKSDHAVVLDLVT